MHSPYRQGHWTFAGRKHHGSGECDRQGLFCPMRDALHICQQAAKAAPICPTASHRPMGLFGRLPLPQVTSRRGVRVGFLLRRGDS